METKLAKGDKAPSFVLESNAGNQSLDAYSGEWVVLYFYPKDSTPGCTAEACDFRDLSPHMTANVLGVSGDGIDSHNTFAEAYGLNFPLLVDKDNEVAKAYGAYGQKTVFGKTSTGVIRSTFIINPAGIVEEAMYNVDSQGHAQKVADRLAELQASSKHQ